MKVNGPSNLGSAAAASRYGRSPSGADFSVPADAASTGDVAFAAPTVGMTGVSSLDALLALQEVSSPLERRRKALSRAGRILDVLEEIKIALVDGDLGPEALERLVSAVRQERGGVEDAALTGLLTDIETRAAVEIAKLEMAGSWR